MLPCKSASLPCSICLAVFLGCAQSDATSEIKHPSRQCDFDIKDGRQLTWPELRQYQTPVILRNIYDSHEAAGLASRDAFKMLYGGIRLRVYDSEVRSRFGGQSVGNYTQLSSWLDGLNRTDAETFIFSQEAKLLSQMMQNKHYVVPRLVSNILGESFVSISGARSAAFPLHQHDLTWAALAAGEKLWLVHPPKNLPIPPHRKVKRKRLRKIKGMWSCIQQPSEIVFLPAAWWHATYSITPWSVAFGGQSVNVDAHDPVRLALRLGDASALEELSRQEIDRKALLADVSLAGHEEMVNLMISKGANANAPGALHAAARSGVVEIVSTLLLHRAHPDAVMGDGGTALQRACAGGFEDVVQRLLTAGAEVNRRDSTGEGCLPKAVMLGHSGTVRLLLESRADLLEKSDGASQLHRAAYNGHRQVTEIMLDHGLDVNARENKLGGTPLHWSAFDGNAAVARLLLERGAENHSRMPRGETPADLARRFGHKALEELLQSWQPKRSDARGTQMVLLAVTVFTCAAVFLLVAWKFCVPQSGTRKDSAQKKKRR